MLSGTRRPVVIVAWFASVALAATIANAFGSAASSPVLSGGGIDKVKTRWGAETSWFTESYAWVDVPGASLTMTVPSGQEALFLARFSAYVSCFNGDDLFVDPCRIRIRVQGPGGNSTMEPQVGLMDKNQSSPNAFAADRSFGPAGPGNYTFWVQVRNPGGTDARAMGLQGWHFAVERVAA